MKRRGLLTKLFLGGLAAPTVVNAQLHNTEVLRSELPRYTHKAHSAGFIVNSDGAEAARRIELAQDKMLKHCKEQLAQNITNNNALLKRLNNGRS